MSKNYCQSCNQIKCCCLLAKANSQLIASLGTSDIYYAKATPNLNEAIEISPIDFLWSTKIEQGISATTSGPILTKTGIYRIDLSVILKFDPPAPEAGTSDHLVQGSIQLEIGSSTTTYDFNFVLGTDGTNYLSPTTFHDYISLFYHKTGIIPEDVKVSVVQIPSGPNNIVIHYIYIVGNSLDVVYLGL